MAYDPATGQWKDEDLSVSKRLTGLLSKDNDYMKQAATVGRQAAQRRGLLNSTLGVQAVESARINAALPIASQESSQANDRYLQGRGLQSQRVLTDLDIGSRERMQGRDLEHQTGSQLRDIESREKMQGAEIQSLRERQQTGIDQDRWLAQFNADTQQRLQGFDNDVRLQLAALDASSAERIASLNVATSQLNNAASLAAQFESFYTNFLTSLMNNPDLPADTRQEYMDHANAMRESNYTLLETLYGFDLEWQA